MLPVIVTDDNRLITLTTDRVHILARAEDGKWWWMRTSNSLISDISGLEEYRNRINVEQNEVFGNYVEKAGWKYGTTDVFTINIDGTLYNAKVADNVIEETLPWVSIDVGWDGNRPCTLHSSAIGEAALRSTLSPTSYLMQSTVIGTVGVLGFGPYSGWSGNNYNCTPIDIYTGTGDTVAARKVRIDGYDYDDNYFSVY